jgi:putative transposase
MLKDIAAKKMVTPVARREAVAHLCQTYEVSQRRACTAIVAERSSVRYRSLRPDDGAVRARLRELAASAGASAIGVCMSCCAGRACT